MIWCLLVRQYKWFYSTVNFFCGLLTKFQIWNTFFVRGSISCRPIKQTKTVNFLMLKCERNFRIWNCINLVYILLYNLASFIIFDQNELIKDSSNNYIICSTVQFGLKLKNEVFKEFYLESGKILVQLQDSYLIWSKDHFTLWIRTYLLRVKVGN